MKAVAWDSWAFIETMFDGPLATEVEDLSRSVGRIVTVRDVVFETFTYIVRQTKSERIAMDWLENVARSRMQVFDPPFQRVIDFARATTADGSRTLVDLSLAFIATEEGVSTIASGDHEFRRLGLEPLFAGR